MKLKEPKWLEWDAVLILHNESLEEHGGLAGVRDEGLLESALNRPQNLFHYERVNDLARLAASYGFGIAKNHPFHDGNKRAALQAATVFLWINGFELDASQLDATNTVFQLAAGEVSELAFAKWLKANSIPRGAD
jgi:death-on-curing protein